jgi:Baseplate J-like protein
VSPPPTPHLDDRDAAATLAALRHRLPAYLPGWQTQEGGAGMALLQIVARYAEVLHERLNGVPDKHLLAFLDLLGLSLVAPRAARAPIVFAFSPPSPAALPLPAAAGNNSEILTALGVPPLTPPPAPMPEPPLNLRVPASTQVAANAPSGGAPMIFETEEAIGLAGAKLAQVVSLWPGRDTYADHSSDLAAAQPFTLFQSTQTTPHILYLAHDGYFALTGTAKVEIAFDLLTTASDELATAWDYWDGQGWHPFGDPDLRASTNPPAEDEDTAEPEMTVADVQDGTRGLTRSGVVTLRGDCLETKPTTIAGIQANWVRARLTTPMPPNLSRRDPIIRTVRVNTVIERLFDSTDPARIDAIVDFQQLIGDLGLPPDQALADTGALDISKAFYPFGPTTQPGSVFYFSSEEIFAKSKAEVRAAFVLAVGPMGDPRVLDDIPEMALEHWDGRTWRPIPVAVLQIDNLDVRDAAITGEEVGTVDPDDLSARIEAALGANPPEDEPPREGVLGGVIGFTIPDGGIPPSNVNGKDGRWIRIRIVRGSFAKSRTVAVPDIGETSGSEEFTITEHHPPLLAGFRLAYVSRAPRTFPERTVAFNDFAYVDHTADVRSPGSGFAPFHAVADVTPALYLGFDGPLPVDNVSIYLALQEQGGLAAGQPLTWEYWDGANWREISVQDETARLVRPGMLALIGAADSALLARFDAARHWLRARLREDGEPLPTRVEGIFPNAVWALHAQTVRDEVLGSGNGEPNQSFFLARRPVLDREIIEVRELDGPRAAVELPILAREVDPSAITVVPDPTGRPREVWIRWQSRPNLYASGPDDRHYVLEPARGRIVFARAIPAGATNVRARRYRTGGGAVGNVPAGAITQLLGGIPYVNGVSNPRAAEGGADGETVQEVRLRGPQTLRHRERSMAAPDYESLAREASPGVAIARALSATHPSGRRAPGWVTLIVVPESKDPRPQPSFELRRQVQDYILARAAGDLAGLAVIGPTYLEVGATCTISPVDMTQAGPVGVAVRVALEAFFHPVTGGPDGTGWPFGRAVHLSDVAAIVESVPGVDFVQELELLLEGIPQDEVIEVSPGHIVVAGRIQVRVRAGET